MNLPTNRIAHKRGAFSLLVGLLVLLSLSSGCASQKALKDYQDEVRQLREERTRLKKDNRGLRMQLESLGAWRVRVPFLGAPDGKRFLVEFDHKHGAGESISKMACSSLPNEFLGTWSPAA